MIQEVCTSMNRSEMMFQKEGCRHVQPPNFIKGA